MNKRFIIASIALLLAVAPITGCGDNSIENSSASASSGEKKNEKSSDKEENIIGETDAYTVYLDYFAKNIGYPQVKGMSDSALEEKINELLKSIEYSRFKTYAEMNEEPDYESYAEVNYCDDDVLTVTQMAFFDGGTLETGGYSLTTVNLNMKTGEELELNDVLTDIDAAAEDFYNNNGVVIVNGYDGADINDFITERHIESIDDMAEYIAGANFAIVGEKNVGIRFPTSDGGFLAYIE